MRQEQLLERFKEAGALLEGHFLLSSGLHSDRYLQCALVLQHPKLASEMGNSLGSLIQEIAGTVDLVVAPALGGILVAHEVARALGVRGIFVERTGGRLSLRRGFRIEKGERTVVVEDVITTGGSTRETITVVRESGGLVSAAGALIDRSGGRAELGIPRVSLALLDVPAYSPQSCPMCRTGTQAIRPGSR